MKKIISMILAFALVVSSVTVSEVKADAEEGWKKSAIAAPAAGSLVGAGYIDIVFNTNIEDAREYTVFFDGEIMGRCEADAELLTQKWEVYTTKVAAHTVSVEVTLNDERRITSDTVTFYVSKKGLAKRENMGSAVKIQKMNLSWYYDQHIIENDAAIGEGVSHVPMLWGSKREFADEMEQVDPDCKYILGYHEPDLKEQSNLTPEQALKLWPLMQNTDKRTVSPATSSPDEPSDWLDSFMEGINADEKLKCDCVAVHCRGDLGNVQSVLNAVDAVYEKYSKPIWITELSLTGDYDFSYENVATREKTAKYLEELVSALDSRDYVERYAWLPYDIHNSNEIGNTHGDGALALFDYESGKLTDLGFLYASIGNPRGYETETLTEEDKYIYIEPTTEGMTTEEVTTKAESTTPTTKTPTIVVTTTGAITTSGNTVLKPAKISIKSAKNLKKKSIIVKWKKAVNAKKYQVQYSLNKKFKKGNKTKSTKKLTYSISKLKKKKMYYVRVRGVNGKVYGAWSKTKKVKIKK